MGIFNEGKERYLPQLEQFVPIVERVHGGSHPEFRAVRKVFDAIRAKIKEAGEKRPDLGMEFKKLREITNNYNIPADVCETYAAVYRMLAEMDKAYQA